MVKEEDAGEGSLRVLIVEDDEEAAELLESLFKRQGYRVVGRASSGEEALEKYREHRPDIVTMDIMMPAMDGRECARRILEEDDKANIVVVSVLGREELQPLSSLGVKAFVKKPFEVEELFSTLAKTARPPRRSVATSPGSLFIDILRHDALNPLGLIKNFADMLLDDAPDSMRQEIEAIRRNADRVIELIEDASTLAKLNELTDFEVVKVDVSALVGKALVELGSEIKRKGIIVDNRLEDRLFLEAGTMVENAFHQLLSNAVKYSPEGGRIVISAEQDGHGLLLSIADSGPGVKEEYRKAIFERLERVKKRGVRGTGLGLAIVKRVVELHKGRVWVEDNPGGGSVFKVWLPRRRLER